MKSRDHYCCCAHCVRFLERKNISRKGVICNSLVLGWDKDSIKLKKAVFGFIKDVITKMNDYHLSDVVVEFHRMAIDTNVTAPVNVTDALVTNTVEPPTEGQPSNAQVVQAVEAWKHLEFLCHNYESLERKYKTEDVGIKKFVVACFLDYKMVDSKNVITQVQDLPVLLHDIHVERMTVSEAFQVAAIIEKLPPSWVEFKNYLKHKRKEMSVEDLVVCLRIEEDNKLA
ncbi:hypothetical protein Tco_0537268 [Tanacetum coccineum]